MEIDIRTNSEEDIKVIRFRNPSSDEYYADCVQKKYYSIDIVDSDSERNLIIGDKTQALNLIEALKKAIELGWFE